MAAEMEVPQEGGAIGKLLAEARKPRPLYVFKVPASVGSEIKSVGLVQLTVSEEIALGDACASQRNRLPMALAKASLVQVDGKLVGDADDSREIAWSKMGPKVRALILLAYNKLHIPQDDALEAFLKSEEVVVS